MILFKFIIIYLLLFNYFSFSCQSQNLAFHKKYALSVKPNYPYAADSLDQTSLTDGIYSKGRFWTEPSTDGWQRKPVTITIDLENVEPIKEVTFNTVRSQGVGISFPKNILIFISDDKRNFKYVGDAADIPINLPGETYLKKFSLDEINLSGRFVTISVIPEGQYIFCDEIEVLKGKIPANPKINLINTDSLKTVIDSLKKPNHNKRELLRAVESFENVQKKNTVSIKINSKTSAIRSELSDQNILGKDLLTIKKKIQKEYALYLRNKFGVPFIVQKYNPWDSLNEFHFPINNFDLKSQFLIYKGDVAYGAFVITNADSISRQFSFNISNNESINKIDLFTASYVLSTYYCFIPDALIKTDKVTIGGGLSEMFIFKITGINSGTDRSKVIISSTQKKVEFWIDSHIVNRPKLNETQNLNINVWAYLNTVMLRSDIPNVIKDLKEHHTNTIVIPPSVLPSITTTDFTNFVSYISNLKDIKNIILYTDYSSLIFRKGLQTGQFLSPDWKNKFVNWYNHIEQLIADNGLSGSKVFLYPYDEVSEGNIADFKRLILWAKKTIPTVKFYATFNTKIAIDSLLPLIDIAQILPSLASKLPLHNCEVWIYTGNTPSRAQSPYKFYRLMAWSAFINNYKGIGFWNYADERNGYKLNLVSNIPNFNGSYSVIYNGPKGEIISSRRWEAFKLGIEDYSILGEYANKFGINNAKALAAEVLLNSTDQNEADRVKYKMMTRLLSIK
jgi:hypothetical protein